VLCQLDKTSKKLRYIKTKWIWKCIIYKFKESKEQWEPVIIELTQNIKNAIWEIDPKDISGVDIWEIQLSPWDKIYTMTDWFYDQFGWYENKDGQWEKFKGKRLIDLIKKVNMGNISAEIQANYIRKIQHEWQGNRKSTDDRTMRILQVP
jgi:hypothetical protein